MGPFPIPFLRTNWAIIFSFKEEETRAVWKEGGFAVLMGEPVTNFTNGGYPNNWKVLLNHTYSWYVYAIYASVSYLTPCGIITVNNIDIT